MIDVTCAIIFHENKTLLTQRGDESQHAFQWEFPVLCYLKKGEIVLNEHNDFEWLGLEDLERKQISEADKKLIQLSENLELLEKYSREKMNNTR